MKEYEVRNGSVDCPNCAGRLLISACLHCEYFDTATVDKGITYIGCHYGESVVDNSDMANKEASDMCETKVYEDTEVYNKLVEMFQFFSPYMGRKEAETRANHVLRIQGKLPPKKSPFSKISPGKWYSSASVDADVDWIYSGDGKAVCRVSAYRKNFEANKVVIIAAPDMRKVLYKAAVMLDWCELCVPESRTDEVNALYTKICDTLRAAGVDTGELE